LDTNKPFIYRLVKVLSEQMGKAFPELKEQYQLIENVIKEEESEVPYSGIAISIGGGRTNVCFAYRSLPIVAFSVNRAGDWVDARVAEATGTPLSQVIRHKERKLDFDQLDNDNDIIFALSSYYDELIKFIMSKFSAQFAKIKTEYDNPLPIVIGGGSSLPNGFVNRLEKVVRNLDLPFEISEVKHADDPHNAVAKGLLTSALIAQKRLGKEEN